MSDKQYVYGFHAVEALLNSDKESVSTLYCLKGRQDKRLQKIQQQADKQGLTVRLLSREEMDALVPTAKHQGVIAESNQKIEVYDETFLKSRIPVLMDSDIKPFILILDGVTDPHNLGACLRSAEAAGVQFVIIPKDNAASMNATVAKVACGAAEVIPLVRVTNLVRTIQWLQQQGVWVLGAAGEAENLHYQADFTGAMAIAMGSEGKGLRRLTREACDGLVRIPMMGNVSSLNVSVATGVCLFEALRQRSQ